MEAQVNQQPRLEGRRVRLLYSAFRLMRALGLSADPQKMAMQPVEARKAMRAASWMTMPAPADVSTTIETIPARSGALAIKRYTPAKLDPATPRVLFLHGGGWIHGGLETLDPLCAMVSQQARCMVVSLEYRLAPETPFPGALEDCDDALEWLAGDTSLGALPSAGIVVMGESAGGNLAAALCVLRARRGASPISRQILLYPALDATLASESMNLDLPGLTRGDIAQLMALYRGEAELTDPLLSPLFAENFADLPPALILTADYDPLRDDGVRFAAKLAEAGVAARHLNYPGMPHGFFFIPRLCPAAAQGIEEISRELRGMATQAGS